MNSSMISQKGQALLVSVFIFGLLLLVGSLSLATVGVSEVQQKVASAAGEKALYAASSGVEEMLYRLAADSNYGSSTPVTVEGQVGTDTSYSVTISGESQNRTITSNGTSTTAKRKIEVQLGWAQGAGNISLAYAAQVGQGGLMMHSSSEISGAGGADGNVYSNGPIDGYSSSKIKGNAWAVAGINPSGSTLQITKNAYGSLVKNCIVTGNTYSPVQPTNCIVQGSTIITPAPTPISLPQVDLDYWRNAALVGGTINGNYELNSGTASLGPKVITGNLVLNSSAKLTVTGTLWVYGTLSMNSSSDLILDEAFGANGTVILLDHPSDKVNNGLLRLNSSSEVKKTSQGGYILFISTNESSNCSVTAAEFNSSANASAIIANSGCVKMNGSSDLVALSAYKLTLNSSVQITYETGLSSELYLPGPGVGGSGGNFGWSITTWDEVP